MEKSNQLAVGRSPCEQCDQPATIELAGHFYCNAHSPKAGEKRASNTGSDSFKSSIDQMVDFHLND